MKNRNIKLILWVVAVTILTADVLVYPSQPSFRFSIASSFFLYSLLSLPELLIIPTGSLVAGFLFVFEVLLDIFWLTPQTEIASILMQRFPNAIYFLILAITLKYGGLKRYAGRPFTLSLAALLAGADITANIVQAILGMITGGTFTLATMAGILLASLIQVFLVASLISISQLSQMRALDQMERARYERSLLLASNLYDEYFFMQKSAENMERVMAKSYDLYKQLRSSGMPQPLGDMALEVAEEVHELKKDANRIKAGIAKVIDRREGHEMYLSELLELVLKSNRNYSLSLEKSIQFQLSMNKDLTVEKIYPLLAILNNIVINAIEAIPKEGNISIEAVCRLHTLNITISDDGEPIDEKDRELIFKPGYTTKFSPDGAPSTGIGLAYVRGLVEDMRGSVWLETGGREKRFRISLPLEQL